MIRHISPLITSILLGVCVWLVDSVIYALTALETSIFGALFTEVSLLRISIRIVILLIFALIGGIRSYLDYAEERSLLGLDDDALEIFSDSGTRSFLEESREPQPQPELTVADGFSRVQQKLADLKPESPSPEPDYASVFVEDPEPVVKSMPVLHGLRPIEPIASTKVAGYEKTLFRVGFFGKKKRRDASPTPAKRLKPRTLVEAELFRSERLWQYAGNLGECLNLTTAELCAMKNLCYCYNLGTFATDRLEIINHAEYGALILEDIADLANCANMVRYHHEKWDGSGVYGLAGLEIPLGSRIFSVVWVYDALTRLDGAWRLPNEEALEMLYLYSDTALDPELVALFIGMMSKGKMIVDNTAKQVAFSR